MIWFFFNTIKIFLTVVESQIFYFIFSPKTECNMIGEVVPAAAVHEYELHCLLSLRDIDRLRAVVSAH